MERDFASISLIVPAYNEQEAILPVIDEYYPYVDEIIVVDDGSSDETYVRACTRVDAKVKVYQHAKNQGKVGALRTGVSHASGDIIVFTDADCTYPACYVPEMVRILKEGKADLVLGARLEDRKNIPLFNRIGNTIFSSLAGYISGKIIQDAQTGYRAMFKDRIPMLDVTAKSLEFETKMTVRAAKLGYTIIEIPIVYRERVGVSKLHPIRDGTRMLRGLVSIAWNETSPLGKMILAPSISFVIIGLLFGLYSLYERFSVYHLNHEYFPMIAIFSVLLGIQIFSIGLVVDYLTKKLDRIEERIFSLNEKKN
ncbi:MAG: glycosyltransferase family 2 protein [Methanomicrobiales archaeon]|jgi:glycosyltransferase involved in cell wall biosynthesis|nr:glycosyltransferase family 2 protein [Methanomicrobiales archaeon]